MAGDIQKRNISATKRMFKNDWWQLKRRGYSIYGTKYYFEATEEKLDLDKDNQIGIEDIEAKADSLLKQIMAEPMRERISKLELNPYDSAQIIEMESEGGYATTMQKEYFMYFFKKYRSPDFYITGRKAPILVGQNNKIIGGIMPLNHYGDN